MESKVIIEEHRIKETNTIGRKKVSIEIILSEEENNELGTKQVAKHINTNIPAPCLFYTDADPSKKIVAGTPKWNNTPYKAYFLITARRVLLNRPILGRTCLRIPFPGKIELGFINPKEEQKLIAWWEKVKPAITTELREIIFCVKDGKGIGFEATKTKIVNEEKVNLNPINPSEKKGVRKRSLDTY